jgi:signal transduction histidine kinase
MEQVEEGDLTVKVQIDSTDEFARVGRGFNSMIQKLDIAQKTMEKHHREQMARAIRLASLGELASGIAHEVRNPLIGIARAVETLSRQFQPQDQRSEITTLMTKELERLDGNIKAILMYARPKPVQFSCCNLNEIMEQALFLANHDSNISDIIIEKDYAPNLPEVEADNKLIVQVFINIILNAIQALEGKGTLLIKTESVDKDDHPSVLIKIKDTGKGMSEETVENIFKPFFTTKSQKTGLGLSIVQNTIAQHHGSISVESKLHQGSTFTIILPQDQSAYIE